MMFSRIKNDKKSNNRRNPSIKSVMRAENSSKNGDRGGYQGAFCGKGEKSTNGIHKKYTEQENPNSFIIGIKTSTFLDCFT